MTIWWCQEHDSVKSHRGPDECQAYFLRLQGLMELDLTPCRMVEMHLVPVERLPTADEVFGILADPTDEKPPSTR